MREDPTIVEFNTESVEGPVTIKVDGNPVLKLEFKSKPGLLHVVLPQRYRMKEVPHSSPELNEGVHYAVLHNGYFLENQRLEDELHRVQAQCARAEDLAMAYSQGLTEEMAMATVTPLMLEVWDEEESVWGHIPWRDLKEGMRFRQRHPSTGELVEGVEGEIDYLATTDSEWRDDVWSVHSEACSSNHLQRDRKGVLITHPHAVKSTDEVAD